LKRLRFEALSNIAHVGTIGQRTNCTSEYNSPARSMPMQVTKLTTAIPSLLPAGDDGPQLHLRGSTWNTVILTGKRVKMVMMGMMWMRIKRKMYRKIMMD
jgi:hypothetical protein